MSTARRTAIARLLTLSAAFAAALNGTMVMPLIVLALSRIPGISEGTATAIAAAEFSSRQVNANNRGLRACEPTEEEERSAAGRADLQGAFKAPGSENLAKGRQLACHLGRREKMIRANKIHEARHTFRRSRE